MEPIRHIKGFDQLKLVSDPRRMAILRLLMVEPTTLSQLGQILDETPARVRHHLKILEKAGMVELVSTRVVRGFVEKYYQARAQAYVLQEMLLPAYATNGTVAILGSHDLLLETLTRKLRQQFDLDIIIVPVGSLEGLIALRQGFTQIAGCHLLDAASGEYNIPYVKHILPDRHVSLITLAHREQGLLVSAGNPLHVHSLQDLGREGITLVNRNRGSGTRLWLDQQIETLGLNKSKLKGYTHEVRTHTAVAQAILAGEADTGIGLHAAASQSGLDFIPLFHERFDLVVTQEIIQNCKIQPFFEALQQPETRLLASDLTGYDTSHMGEQITL